MKCQAINKFVECGKRARFKITDIVCKQDESSSFWVCNDCIEFYIYQNKDNPHYIIVEEGEK